MSAQEVRALDQMDSARQHRLAQVIEQEGGAPVQRAPRHRAQQVPDQRARHFGRVQHRKAARRHRARRQPRHGPRGGALTHGFRRRQRVGVTVPVVPVVALHRLAFTCDQRKAQAVAGAALRAQKAVAVGRHEVRLLDRGVGAL